MGSLARLSQRWPTTRFLSTPQISPSRRVTTSSSPMRVTTLALRSASPTLVRPRSPGRKRRSRSTPGTLRRSSGGERLPPEARSPKSPSIGRRTLRRRRRWRAGSRGWGRRTRRMELTILVRLVRLFTAIESIGRRGIY